jgi:hypothetical protein
MTPRMALLERSKYKHNSDASVLKVGAWVSEEEWYGYGKELRGLGYELRGLGYEPLIWYSPP